MEKLINETVDCAAKQFTAFGFTQEQIEPLLASGRRDLANELSKLETVLRTEPIDLEKLNLALHSVKGLLLNMGNHAAAETFNELRNDLNNEKSIAEIKSVLGM